MTVTNTESVVSDPAQAPSVPAEAPNPDPVITYETAWEGWFAWHPVRLYMTGHYAWLRRIHRRCVTKAGVPSCDYTDSPEDFPHKMS